MKNNIDKPFEQRCAEYGFVELKQLANGEIAGLSRFIFTTGLVVGIDDDFGAIKYRSRFCYEHAGAAREALQLWDGSGDPTGPWIKEKGSRVERLNPLLADDDFPNTRKHCKP